MANNGFAALVKQRSGGATKRRRLDDYETPLEDALLSLSHLPDLSGKVFEPAAGSGRVVRALKQHYGSKVSVTAKDIKSGDNFLERRQRFAGHIITNPPYRDDLAEKFARHSFLVADGRVCLLVQSGFIWGGKRAAGLFEEYRPERVVVMANRIRFFESGGTKRLKSQFYSHAWICWPDRKAREAKAQRQRTDVVWAYDSF